MEKFAFYIGDCTEEILREYLEAAKTVANIVHHKVTVHTDTEVYEVNEDEKEEKEQEQDKVVKHSEEKFESG